MQGPVAADVVTPEPVGGGAEGAYSMTVDKDWGEMNLMGCHDSNYNQIIDAADQCGAYISEPNVDANPVDVCCENNDEANIQIPLGDYELDLVPFVRFTGNITSEIGALGDYAAGSQIYVTALKYRPIEDVDVDELLENSYDYEVFNTDDLAAMAWCRKRASHWPLPMKVAAATAASRQEPSLSPMTWSWRSSRNKARCPLSFLEKVGLRSAFFWLCFQAFDA
jgi:hypothetical protein